MVHCKLVNNLGHSSITFTTEKLKNKTKELPDARSATIRFIEENANFSIDRTGN